MLLTAAVGFLGFIFAVLFAVVKILPFCAKCIAWHQKMDHSFPHWPISWLTGNLKQIKSYQDFLKNNSEFMERGDKAFVWWLGPHRCILECCHPDSAKVLLRSSEPKARQGGGYDFIKPWIGDGLLVSEGKKWERNRHLLTPAFHFDILHDYVVIYNQCIEVFLDKMEKQSQGKDYIEVTAPLVMTALDILLHCMLSYNDDIQQKGESHPYVKAVKRLSTLLLERSLNIHLHTDFIYFKLTKSGKEFARLSNYVHDFAETIIASRRKKLEQPTSNELVGKRHLDFLDILLAARDEAGCGLTDREIRDEVDTFTFAGHDTTSTTLGWCMYALAVHQDIQQRVYEDVCSVLGNRTEVKWEDLGNFQYLLLFIKETMRMYTPVPLISRQVTSAITIEGVDIPEGVIVDISIYKLHKNPYVWEEPEIFHPERFDKDAIVGKDPYMYVPFSAGPRNCIGQNFAMNELKTVVARIVHRFHLEAHPSIDPQPYPEITLRAKNGIHIKFTRRTQ